MAEYISAAIHIGGPVSRALAADLAAVIIESGAMPEFNLPGSPGTAEWLEAAVNPTSGVLDLCHHEARWGCFEELEAWLVEHGIPFDRHRDAKYEFDGTLTSFRPTLGTVERTATQDGDPTVRLVEVERVRELLRAALTERSPEKVRGALTALDEAMGPEIPPLDPFVIVD